MRGGRKIQVANMPAVGKEEIILKNNFELDRNLDEQIDLFSEIIIDIYFENNSRYEESMHANRSGEYNP